MFSRKRLTTGFEEAIQSWKASNLISGSFATAFATYKVMCGDWTAVINNDIAFRNEITGVVLDPPYSSKEHTVKYAGDTRDVAADVRKWAIENGNNPLLRIALCGYEGEHKFPDNWECFAWKASRLARVGPRPVAQ